jgi:hypothetical protein
MIYFLLGRGFGRGKTAGASKPLILTVLGVLSNKSTDFLSV